MKVSIVDNSNNRYVLQLSNSEPRLDQVCDDILLLENYNYKLIVNDENLAENIELYIGDYNTSLEYNSQTGCFATDSGAHFSGCFDLVCISVVSETNGNEQIQYSKYIRVATTKQTSKQVETMLDEIENNIPNLLDVCFSKNHKRSGINNTNTSRSIWNTLALVDELIEIYEKNYRFFLDHGKTYVERIPVVVDARSMKELDQDSLRWIVSNPDNLEPTRTKTGIHIGGESYMPAKIKTFANKHTYDVYENRVILGFLFSVCSYIEKQIDDFNNELTELSVIPDSIIERIPNTHDLTGRCIYVYYKGIIDRFIERKEKLIELLNKYEKLFDFDCSVLNTIPKLTNTFKKVYQYRVSYECIVKWFEYGDYNLNHIDYLFKLKTLTRIFEYYCLIKLQTAISMTGYSLKETDRVIYDSEDEDEQGINNLYRFSRNNYELTLLYEPKIWTNQLSNAISLYSTGYNFTKAIFNDYWTPDFVIKISSDKNEYYLILDSKYMSYKNVKKKAISELVLKYSAQIASMNKYHSDVVGVGALYPDYTDSITYFKKNRIGSSKESLPLFFALSVVGGAEGTEMLRNGLANVLSVISDLDFLPNPRYSKQNSSENNSSAYEDQTPISNHVAINDSVVQTIEVLDNKSASVLGRCKRCLYYGRSKCLLKGVITQAEQTCENYTSWNNSRFVSNDACKHYINGMKKGRMIIECRMSGRAACVGPEHCKYYQRKKER